MWHLDGSSREIIFLLLGTKNALQIQSVNQLYLYSTFIQVQATQDASHVTDKPIIRQANLGRITPYIVLVIILKSQCQHYECAVLPQG